MKTTALPKLQGPYKCYAYTADGDGWIEDTKDTLREARLWCKVAVTHIDAVQSATAEDANGQIAFNVERKVKAA